MSHRTHSDGVPAPRRTTRAMFQRFLKSHAGGGVVERPAKAVSPPHVFPPPTGASAQTWRHSFRDFLSLSETRDY